MYKKFQNVEFISSFTLSLSHYIENTSLFTPRTIIVTFRTRKCVAQPNKNPPSRTYILCISSTRVTVSLISTKVSKGQIQKDVSGKNITLLFCHGGNIIDKLKVLNSFRRQTSQYNKSTLKRCQYRSASLETPELPL